MKLTDPEIKVTHNVGEITTKSFPVTNGVTTAHIAYKEGAFAMAKMFRDAINSGDLGKVMELARATETNSFYEY